MIQENWRDQVRGPATTKAKLRKLARDTVLSASALFGSGMSGNFVRPLYSHYVFDDQRADFERLMRHALDQGEFVDTAALVQMVRGDVPIDGRYFHMSFDDGLHCLHRNAAPILADLGIPSIVFANSAMVQDTPAETEASWRKATNYLGKVALMNWQELREVSEAGMEIGAHTRTHRRLSAISAEPGALEDEIAGCKTDIEAALGTTCRYFAWPFGTKADVDAASLEAIKAAGYEAAFGVYREPVVGGATDPFMIPRHHFEPQWPFDHVRYFMAGGREK